MDAAVEVSVPSSQNQQQQGGSPRPFNQNHQNTRQFGHGSSSRGRGVNGDGFRNQNNNSHRRHHHQSRGGFNFGNSNRQHGNNNARPLNLQYRPQGFVNGAPHFVEPQPPMSVYSPPPNLPFIENHHQFYNFPQLPSRPQFPGFMAPPPMMYNGNPYYPEEHSGLYGAPMMPLPMPYMDAMRGPPVGPVRPQPPAPVVQNLPDPEAALCSDLLRQINYYFSDENLAKDRYLKSKMDEQGWVSVYLIAEFRRVAKMTSNIDLILRALRPSWIVEIQGDKMRRRGDWMKYIITPSNMEQPSSQDKLTSGMEEPSSEDLLIAGINNIRLDLTSEPEVEKVESEG